MRPRGVSGQAAHPQQPAADEQQSGTDEQPDRHVRGQPARRRRDDEDRAGGDDQPQAGLEGAVAQHVLQVDGEVEEHREDARGDAERRDRASGERRQPEQRKVEHGLRAHAFGDEERRDEHRGRGEAGEHRCVGEAGPA